jgi:hypothetical protein
MDFAFNERAEQVVVVAAADATPIARIAVVAIVKTAALRERAGRRENGGEHEGDRAQRQTPRKTSPPEDRGARSRS